MANHSIKIKGVADFSAIKSEVQDLDNILQKTLGRTGAKIIDDVSLNSALTDMSKAFEKLNSQLEDLKTEGKALDKQLKSSSGDEKKHADLTRQRLDNIRKIAAVEKDRKAVRQGYKTAELPEETARSRSANGNLAEVPDNVIPFNAEDRRKAANKPKEIERVKPKSEIAAVGSAAIQGANDIASSLPGVGQVAHIGTSALSAGSSAAAAGMSAPAVLALGGLAAAATAAVVAISRMTAGFEVFKQAIPNMLQISGMGAKASTGRGASQAIGLGYGQLETLEIQKQLLKSLGNRKSDGTQISQREEENRMLNIMTAARGLGMQPQEIASGADKLRQVGGTDLATKQIGAILEKALTNGMDKSQASNFLNAAVSLLSDINQNGTAQTAEMLNLLSDVAASGRMSPEQVARTLSGMNNAISGSSGENNAFFQTAAARAGLGGGSLLGTQFAVRQGLAGVDIGALQNQVGDTETGRMGVQAIQEMGLGDEKFGQKFAENILGEIKGRFNTDSKEGRQASLGFVGQVFGAKSAPEAAKIMALLEKMSKGAGLSNQDRRLLEDLGKDPEASWRDKTLAALDRSAIGVASMLAAIEKGQFELGRASADLIGKMNEALTALDKRIGDLISSKAFKDLVTGLGEVASTVKNVLGGVFGEISKMPEALSGLFNKFMDNPAELGKTLGKGFAEIVLSIWDTMLKGMKEMWELITTAISNPKKVLDMVVKGMEDSELGKMATKTLKFVDSGLEAAKGFVSGIGAGWDSAKKEKEETGKVTYSKEERESLDQAGTVVRGGLGAVPAVGMGVVGNSVRQMMPTEGEAAAQRNGNNNRNGNTNGASSPAVNVNVDVSGIVDQQRRTNDLLERQGRRSPAPPARTQRDPSRPGQ